MYLDVIIFNGFGELAACICMCFIFDGFGELAVCICMCFILMDLVS